MTSVRPSSLVDRHRTTKLACTWYHSVYFTACLCASVQILWSACVFACVCVCVLGHAVCMYVCVWWSLCYTPLIGSSPHPLVSPLSTLIPLLAPVFISAPLLHWCNLISSSGWTSLERPLIVAMVTNGDTCHLNQVKLFAHLCAHTPRPTHTHIYKHMYTLTETQYTLADANTTHTGTQKHI